MVAVTDKFVVVTFVAQMVKDAWKIMAQRVVFLMLIAMERLATCRLFIAGDLLQT
jgi:hypothetical protein